MKRELLLGCGNSRDKKVHWSGTTKEWANLTTLDIDPDVEPDVEWDLNKIPLPFDENTFDEIHAYECLEHCGTQRDAGESAGVGERDSVEGCGADRERRGAVFGCVFPVAGGERGSSVNPGCDR